MKYWIIEALKILLFDEYDLTLAYHIHGKNLGDDSDIKRYILLLFAMAIPGTCISRLPN